MKAKQQVWAECNDGHTLILGANADPMPVSDIILYAGAVFWRDAEAAEHD